MNDRQHHVDRVLGMLAGTAVGDGLGAPFEGRPAVSATALDRWAVSSRTLRHTDDTAMTLVLAEHLARTGGVDRRALASEFAAAWSAEPHRGYGRGAARVLAAIEAGTPWQRAAASVFPGGSWGNGAAMRAAPVAVVAPGVHEAAELARSSAEPTHAHEHGGHGAALQAVAVHLALRGGADRPLDVDALLRALADVVPPGPWQEKLVRVGALLEDKASPEEAAASLGHDISALGSVPLAVFAFLRHVDEPGEAIRFAVLGGGDTDTIAAMTGALAGARHGHCGLPASWTARLESAGRLPGLAARLSAAASTGP